MLLRTIVLAIIPTISGCLYIPAIGSEPRFEKNLGEIVVGSTTEDDLFLMAGEPDITRKNGSIAIYDNSRITGYFIMLEPAIYNPIEELGSTLVQFDENVVSLISSLPDGYDCYANTGATCTKKLSESKDPRQEIRTKSISFRHRFYRIQ